MFKSAFQSGASVEVLTTRSKTPLSDWCVVGSANRQFNKDSKGFVIGLKQQSRISIPKNERNGLGLVQNFLVFQVFVAAGKHLTIEIGITDLAGVKRRLVFTNWKELVVNPLHARIPNHTFKKGSWNNLCIDLTSFFNDIFPRKTFRSIDCIFLKGEVLIRRIFTMRNRLRDTTGEEEDETYAYDMIPHAYELPRGVAFVNQFVNAKNVLTEHMVMQAVSRTSPEPSYFKSCPPSHRKEMSEYGSVFRSKTKTLFRQKPKNNSNSVNSTQDNLRVHKRYQSHRSGPSLAPIRKSRLKYIEPIDTTMESGRDDDSSDFKDALSKITMKQLRLKPKPPAPAPTIFMDPRSMEMGSAMTRINYYAEQKSVQLNVKPFTPPILELPNVNT